MASTGTHSALSRRVPTIGGTVNTPPPSLRCMSSSPSSSPGFRVTYTSPILSTTAVGKQSATTTASTNAPARAAPPRSTAPAPRKMRFTNKPPPKSGWCSRIYPLSLGVGLGAGMTIFSLLRGSGSMIHADAQGQDERDATAHC